MAPRARQAKSKARVQKFEELAQRDTAERVLQHEIVIPPPPRLGNEVVNAKDLRKAYGEKLLIDGLSFSLPRGGIVGIIGPNGAGKTTLFRMIVGQEQPDAGGIALGETVQIAYAGQQRELDPTKNAWEENSGVVWHEGNYQSYIEDLKKRKGPDAAQPHRVAYRKLVRA